MGKNITIIGKAYKPRVAYTNGSSSMLVGYYIESLGGTVNYYDENTGDMDLKEQWTEVYLIGYWEPYVTEIVNKLINQNNIMIIDPWRKIKIKSANIIHYGNTRDRST